MSLSDNYIPLSERNIWSDVTPIPQDDGPSPLVPIMYAADYRDAMDYFRAILVTGEKSERVLELTEGIIRQNPAHYTVWQYRYATLLALQKDLKDELDLMNEFARVNLKSYQVWHHRLLLTTAISPGSPTDEINYIHNSLLPDPKNYHTWAYLYWIYSHFSTLGRVSDEQWQDELDWCEEMLRVDGRNNSAWGWRWFLRVSRPGATGGEGDGKIEIMYALKAIHRIPHNVSAWNYLRGILTHFKRPYTPLLPTILAYTSTTQVIPTSSETDFPLPPEPLPRDTPLPISHALEFLADALVEQGTKEEASVIFGDLAEKYDKIRLGYWNHRKRECLDLV